MNFENWYSNVKSITEQSDPKLLKVLDYPHTLKHFHLYQVEGLTPAEAIAAFHTRHDNMHGEDIWE